MADEDINNSGPLARLSRRTRTPRQEHQTMYENRTPDEPPNPAPSNALADPDPRGQVGVTTSSTAGLDQRLAAAEARAAAAERELRLERDRYAALVTAAANISWTTPPSGLVEDMPLWRAYTGQALDEVRGQGWLAAVHPDDRARALAAWQQAVERQSVYESEYRIRRADGVYHTFFDRGVPVMEPDGAVREWVGVCVDIEERKRAEAALYTQLGDMNRLRELITRAPGEDMEPLLRSVLMAVVASQGAVAGELMLCDSERHELRTAASVGFSPEYVAEVGAIPFGVGACGTAAADRRTVVIEDVREDPLFAPYVAAADRAGYRAVISTPLLTSDGTILGTLSTYFAAPHRPSEREFAQLELYAHHAALLIEQARLLETSHRLEREARMHAGRLDAMFGAMTDGAILMDARGRVIYMNDAAKAWVGTQPEEVAAYVGESPAERMRRFDARDVEGRPLTDEELPQTRILHGERLAGAHLQVVRMRVPAGETAGQDLFFAVSGAPIRDERGTITGGIMMLRDVSDLIHLGREADARAAELETMLDTMPDGVSVLDRHGNIVRMNRAYRELFSTDQHADFFSSPREKRATTQLEDEHGHPLTADERPSARALRGETMVGGSSLDVWFRLPWGQALNLNVSGAPIRDAEGEIIGATLVMHDVSERRKVMEHTRASLAGVLAMAEAMVGGDEAGGEVGPRDLYGLPINPVTQRLASLVRQVLGCARVGIVSLGEQDRMTPIAAIGLSEEQLPHWWQSLDGLPLEHFIGAERLARLRVGEQTLLPLDSGPLSEIAYGGPTSLATPLIVDGRLVGAMAIDYDQEPHQYTDEERTLARVAARLAALVVERERLERERAAAQAESLALQETNRRMQEFLSVAGHELKTPVTVIKANSQMLARWSARQGGLNPREAEMLTRTERQIARLMRLVNDLLDVTRIREGRLELRPLSCDLVAIVREAVSEQREVAPGRVIEFTTTRASVPLHADADRLFQVVTNYLTNALKYSVDSQPVTVTLDVADGQARVAVRDHGPGIPPEHLSRIWQVFERVPGIRVLSGSGVGLGLGLHISREIVERHGGTVGVASTPGQGSTFSFTLPLAPADLPQDRSA